MNVAPRLLETSSCLSDTVIAELFDCHSRRDRAIFGILKLLARNRYNWPSPRWIREDADHCDPLEGSLNLRPESH